MADTINLPVAGAVPKNVAILAGGAGAAFIVYSWWKKRQAAQPVTAVGNVNDLVGATSYTGAPNTAGATGNATVNAGMPDAITTNAEWTQAAVNYLEAHGNFDGGALTAALGKYLTRDPIGLSDAEVSMVQAARGAFGDPPVGGPYSIIHATPAPGGGSNDNPGDPTQQKPPVPGANPHVWQTQAGDTLLNLVPRLYATDPGVNPPTAANLQHRREVAGAIYLTNMFIIPAGIETPLPAGKFITYY